MFSQLACGLGLCLCVGCVFAQPAPDCTRIVSNVKRLACFDEAAGTPLQVPVTKNAWLAPEASAPSVSWVMANEAQRTPGDLAFRLGLQDDGPAGQRRLVISAPAIATLEPRPYLAISCVQNISRLQLLTARPIDGNRVTLQLRTERQATDTRPWQVLENGQLLDAGRGLPAIEQIKALIGGHRIHVVSEHPALDGLSFDAQGLAPLIDQVRKACRW
ncbi:type VI secretion system-associated protein TagO [Pseudomonas monteilii]|nr:type VI secretion system-associated protein TagO [Pseudomonas monteilii]